jgi:hypothetical protein
MQTQTELDNLPGMIRRKSEPGELVKPSCSLTSIPQLYQRPIILLATASINDMNIFNNGLYQNCFMLYRLAEAIGWLPIFCVNQKPKDLNGIPEFLRSCRFADLDDILSKPIHVRVYVEIGMSIASNLRKFMKMMGARTCKLYLGNIVNIDIETPMFLHGVSFSHHVVGQQDEIWTSPHYLMNLEYAACLNGIDPEPFSAKIAPYVWDPCILTDDGRRNMVWKPRSPGEKPSFIIMEPNISFQKNALIPLLIVEEFARINPGLDFELILLNSERVIATGYFKNNIEPSLKGCAGKIKYAQRHDMITLMKNYPSAIPICHHFTNEYNYMVLEFIHAGYPVLHNADAWKDFGYYYAENDTVSGANQLARILNYHHDQIEAYKSHSRALLWRHSIYNPDVQKAWKDLLEGR